MKKSQKPGLGFSGMPSRACALDAPVVQSENHDPHHHDSFTIEIDEDADTATIYLREVDDDTGTINFTRQSASFPLTMLADLVRRRPAKIRKQEETSSGVA